MNQTNQENVIYVDPSFNPQYLVSYNIYSLTWMLVPLAMTVPTLFNIIVFAHPNLKDPVFKIFLTISISDFAYMVLNLVNTAIDVYCEPAPYMCGSRAQLAAFIMDQLSSNYLTSCLALYSILGEIFLSTQRLFIIQNSRILKGLTVKTVGPALTIISLVYYLPYWFAYDFVKTGNVFFYRNQTYVEYSLVANDFANSLIGNWFLSALSIVRMLLVSVVLFIINIISVFYFRKYFSERTKLHSGHRLALARTTTALSTSPETAQNARRSEVKSKRDTPLVTRTDKEASNSIVVMLIMTSFIYNLGTLPRMISYVVYYVDSSASYQQALEIVGSYFIILFPGVKFLVYMTFNRLFREQFKACFRFLRLFRI
jgi:hypothetical protein